MAKSDDYNTVKVMIETGHVRSFMDIFKYIARTTVANDLGIYYSKFKQCLDHVDRFTFKEIYQLARKIGVEGKVIVQLVVDQIEKEKESKIKKAK